MDHLDKEAIESLSEPAKRVFKSLDYRSKQRMLKKAREMAKAEKMKRRKKRRFKKKGIEKLNKGKKQKKGSSSKSERVLFSIHETRELMVQSMHLMLLGSSEQMLLMKKEIRSIQKTHLSGFLKKLPEKVHIQQWAA